MIVDFVVDFVADEDDMECTVEDLISLTQTSKQLRHIAEPALKKLAAEYHSGFTETILHIAIIGSNTRLFSQYSSILT